MRKVDPQLEFLLEDGASELQSRATRDRFGLRAEADPAAPEVIVLVQYAGDPQALEAEGLKIRGIAGDVVTGSIAISNVPALADIAEVERLEAARVMHVELDLAVVESRANLVHIGPPGRRGAGVIVGTVDSGCDFTHPSFRRADGTSRILLIWDQALNPQGTEESPAGFGYGVEYNNAQINAALASPDPFALVRHRDSLAPQHGTHVTGIAAGDGSAPGQGRPAGTFVGVAPEADIIIVADNANGNEGLGTSANTLDAVNYIFQQAAARTQAAVVNMSLGDNLGPHDGTSLLERGLDNLLGGPGRAFVKSAGNAGAARIHAQGNVVAAATVDVQFNSPPGNSTPDQFDLWYEGGDTFRISLVDPGGNVRGPVNVGAVGNFNFPSGNTVRIDHRNNDAFNGDRRVFITLRPGTAAQVLQGNWRIRILSVASPTGGRFDAWIQRGAPGQVPTFLAPHEDPSRTISTPGTAAEVITAANYITRGAGVGSLASTSSRGPTRDGRAAPTVAAPGQTIISAFGHFPNPPGEPYQGMSGTSMAAPHVAGTIALIFQKNRNRTQSQVKACLESSARTDAFTGPVPNTAWGAGKLDAQGAVACTPAILTSVVVCPPSAVVTCARSVVTLCPSVPRATCPVASVVCPSAGIGCQSALACPSAIDACPSAPGGCQLTSVVCGGFQSVACGGPVVIPGNLVVNPAQPVFVPGTVNQPIGQVSNQPPLGALNQAAVVTAPQSGGTMPGDAGAFGRGRPTWPADPGVGGGMPSARETTGEPEGARGRMQPPPEGYFEYDDSWFDDDGR
jgi:subtilisin family serine protease